MKVVLALPGLVPCNLIFVPLLGVTAGKENEDKTEEYPQPSKVTNNEK